VKNVQVAHAAKKTSLMQMDLGCLVTSHLMHCSNSKAKNVLAERKYVLFSSLMCMNMTTAEQLPPYAPPPEKKNYWNIT